jgi:hypothetical protein
VLLKRRLDDDEVPAEQINKVVWFTTQASAYHKW